MAERAENPVTAQAAQWFAVCQRGRLAAEDARAFEAWMDASPHHAVAYARVELTWERAHRLRAVPGGAALTARSAKASRRWCPAAAAAAIVLAIAGTANWWVLRPEVHETALGERRVVTLEDGTRVVLNTSSRLRVEYSDGERTVRLVSGEALFEVAKDASRPFVVHAGEARLRVLGTMFNVRLRGREMVEVSVTEGRVAVEGAVAGERGGRATELVAGKGAIVGRGALATVGLDAQSLRQRTAWRNDLIELRGETLEQAVAEFNRYRGAPLVVGDPRIASIRVGGTFATDESEKFLKALEGSFGIAAVPGSQGTVYLVPMQ